ncbi:MAG: DUF1922 domain-containing protein [Candidatus Bathyarchaeota archaeon]|nr:DUF1922 domain-containing protein [Candidatus Bathyarchaeota archaeon]
MATISILKCTHCGGYVLAAQTQKTKLCPYCGVRVNLQKAPRVAVAANAAEASEMIRRLKAEKGFTREP